MGGTDLLVEADTAQQQSAGIRVRDSVIRDQDVLIPDIRYLLSSGLGGDRGLRRQRLLGGVLHRLLHLLEGPDLDLADALARYAEFLAQILERRRVFLNAARFEDAALAVGELVHRFVQK